MPDSGGGTSMNDDIVSGFDDEKEDSVKLRLQKPPDMEGGLVIYASGYIDTYNSSNFKKRVEKVIEAGFVQIVFQMRGVDYVSSTGIGSFTSFLKTLKSRNGDMVLDQMQPKVYEVFQLLGFSQFFVVTDGIDEACAYFNKKQPSAFPRVFKCPVCSKRLKASKAGRFRCSECKTILVVDAATSVMLG
jgi:anti-sigma B factor antagonist